MTDVVVLLCKWWALGAAVVLAASVVAMLASRLSGRGRDAGKVKEMTK